LGILLRHAWFGLNQAFRRRCAKLGLTPDQYTVLRTLAEAGETGLTQNELAAAMCSDPNTMASLLRRMETSQWIERRPHQTDRRARLVKVLPAGIRQYKRARREAIALQREVLRVLPEDARTEFLAALECVANACRRNVERESVKRGA
jgi:DNA-binding MarR family transcriptional regulator